MKPRKKQLVTTGGAGYTPVLDGRYIVRTVRNRLRNNINPASSYDNPLTRVFNALILNNRDYSSDRNEYADAAWDKYLGFRNNKIKESQYRPSKSKDNNNSKYYTYDDLIINHHIDDVLGPQFTEDNNREFINGALRLKIGDTAIGNSMPVLNDFTYSHGYDNKGDYISVYDKYDINPYKKIFNTGDLSLGIGKPFEFYDRLYLDDYYGLSSPTHAFYLPEVIVKPRKK